MIRLAILLAALFLPQSPRASIEGTVAFLANGAPIAGAEVELTSVEGARVVSRTTKTTPNGHFSFSDLPPGSGYQLVARGTGFRPSAYGQRDSGNRWTSITLTAGQHLTDLQITVQGITQLTGHVTERSGKPVAGATVFAMNPVYVGGRRVLQREAMTATNMAGEYRFSGLEPGRYYIRVSAPNDSAVAPLFIDPALFDRTATPTRRSGIPNNPEGYPAVYYPGVLIESAQMVQLAEGQVVTNIDTIVARSRTGRLRGNVADAASSRRVMVSEVFLLPVDRSADSSASRYYASRDGTFDIRAILPGMYSLIVVTNGPDRLAARMPVAILPGETSMIDVSVSPLGNISGRLFVEGLAESAANFSAFSVTVTPNLRGPIDREQSQPPVTFASVTGNVMADGRFTLLHVPPGDYRVLVTPIEGAYLKSVRLGSADVLDEALSVTENVTASLDITLATDIGSLDGRVLDDKRQSAMAARVVLVPEKSQRLDLYLVVQSSPTGRFQISGIAPGRYRVFAWESALDGAWIDPDFVKAYEKLGKLVEISPGVPEYVEVTVIRD